MMNPCVVCKKRIEGRWFHHYRLNATWCAWHTQEDINEAVGEDVSTHAIIGGIV